jgi:cytochrome b6-f complex iron-sulfur subunit
MDEPTSDPKSTGYGRRDFLSFSWKVLGIGLLGEAAWTSYDILAPRPSGAFGGTVDAGNLIDFKAGTVRYFLDGRFYVSVEGSQLVALYQKCPHLGCRVPFCDSSKQFECPCHGSVFNTEGEYLQGPAPRGMDRFDVTVEDGHVMVDTGSVIQGPARGVLTGPSTPAGPSCSAGEGASTGTTTNPSTTTTPGPTP